MTPRILFLGQKPLGEQCFTKLLQHHRLAVCGVCSNIGTSVWWGSELIHLEARRRHLPFVGNQQRHEDILMALIQHYRIDCLISVQHTWILSRELLEAVKGRAFNLHCAPLPGYKGFNACNHAILNAETRFAATLHWMNPQVDVGDAAFLEEVDIATDETAASLYEKMQGAGLRAFVRLLDTLEAGETPPRTPIVGEGRFYSRSSINALRRIQNPNDATEVDRKTRAFWFPPFEPAYIEKEGRKRHLVPGETP